MAKKSKATSAPIASKVLAYLSKTSQDKIAELSAIKSSGTEVGEFSALLAADRELAGLDPVHAAYVFTQERMEPLFLRLSNLPACKSLMTALAEANEEYLPSYPPVSPLTTSYFICWAMHDLTAGPARESFGSIIMQVGQVVSPHPIMYEILRHLEESRMGFYLHRGNDGPMILLEELVTGRTVRCLSPSGYNGTVGEIWFARVLDDPLPGRPHGHAVVFNTPYIAGFFDGRYFRNIGALDEWLAYFDRTLGRSGGSKRIEKYRQLMKYGLNRNYWNEFIFQGYANHSKNFICLAGIPDRPETLPHSPQND